MGQSLMDEGIKNKDYITASVGNSMVFLSSLTFDKNEARFFGELCSMMTARRLVKGALRNKEDISNAEIMKETHDKDPFKQIQKMINDNFEDLNDDDGKNDK